MNLLERLSKLHPEQRKLLELKLQQQGIDIHQIPITHEYRKSYEYFPLSMEQEPMWVVEKYDPNNPFYEIPGTVMMEGSLDIKLLERSTNEVVKRHEILRAVFIIHEDTPVQYILPSLLLPLQRVDFKGLAAEEQERRLKELREDRGLYAFDLARGPLIKTLLVELGENKYVFITIMHHIIGDLLSLKLFLKEAAWFYLTFSQGSPAYDLPELPFQYVDYACWEQRWFRESITGIETRKKQEAFWLDIYGDEPPASNLPFDFPRPAVKQYEGDHMYFVLKEEEIGALKEIFLKENATLYVILFTIYYVFLAKITGQEDIVVGTPINTRQSTILNNMIGLFVKTAALRNYPQGRKTFRNFLIEVNRRQLDVYKNQDYQLDDLVKKILKERDPAHNPLFDVLFNFIYIDVDDIDMPGLKVMPYRFKTNRIGFDLELICEGTYKQLRLKLSYCTKLFKEETASRFVSYIKKIIATVIQEPDVKISQIDILPAEERKRLLIEFNDTAVDYPEEKTIFELFETQVLKTPDHTAAVFEDRWLSYRGLHEKSVRLAGMLREKGVGPNVIVGLMVERSLEMLTGIMGILKAGGAYLPIDPDYPRERIDYMLKDSGVKLLVTTNNLEAPDFPLLPVAGHRQPAASLAYVIYTSGSTGQPKGVMVEHYSVVNILSALQAAYPLNESDTYLFKTSYIFDVSAAELFGWFQGGGRLAVLEAGGERDPKKIIETIERQCVTHINFVPSMFSVFMEHVEQLGRENIARLSGLKYIFLAGEVLLPGLVERFRRPGTGITLENIYGPTEAAIYSSWYSLSRWDGNGRIPIGKPMPNIRLYILDKTCNLQPIGIPGELCIAGAGIGRGYLNNPGLTAEKFVRYVISHSSSVISSSKSTNDQCPMTNDRLYRTGDLARWLPDGNIEFIGRLDHQVKIRGYRVELGEIEKCLMNHKDTREAVVLAKSDQAGDSYLCAYIAGEKEFEGSELRDYLAEVLPDYMIPPFFIQLEKLPQTPNGKIDRKALPGPDMQHIRPTVEYVSPRNTVEQALAQLWAEALNIEHIGIDDNFFRLGGHSLKATILVSKIRKELNVQVPLAEISRSSTIRELAGYIAGAAKAPFISIQPVEQKEYYELSSAQKRLFIINRMEMDSISYNLPSAVILEGKVDKKHLEDTIEKLIKRHESFRTSFELVNGEPVQRVHEDVDFKIDRHTPPFGHPSQEGIVENFVRPFDLSQAPLIRVGMIHTPPFSFILMLDMHHIITDGFSQAIFSREFMNLFAGNELAPLRIQYKDYARWQKNQKEKLEKQEEYWLDVFNADIPVLNLPTDYPRPTVQSFSGGRFKFTAANEDKKRLIELAAAHGATLYMVLLAIYNVLLAKLSGQEDIVVGTPIAGRRHAELQHIVGMFVNTLALRNFPAPQKTFADFLNEVTGQTLEAFENQDYQFEDLVEKAAATRDAARNPLFDVMFTLQNVDNFTVEIPGLTLKPYEYEFNISKFDLTLTGIERDEDLIFSFEYGTKLFKKETIERFSGYFEKVISEIVEDPGKQLADIEIISDVEKNRILYDFNNTEVEYPSDKTIYELFEEQADRTPDGAAVIGYGCMGAWMHGGIHITYRELNQKANQVAHALKEKGVLADSIIGIKIERSVEMIIGILGILKAGGAYLPIDPDYPQERIDYILKDSGAKLLVTTNNLEAPDFPLLRAAGHRQPATSLAYVIYTSGSTGKPKGALVQHRSLVNLCYWHNNYYRVTEKDHATQYANFAFDASVWEIFPYLIKGAALHIIGEDIRPDIQQLADYYEKHHITIGFLPTQLCQQFMTEAIDIPSLRCLLTGGDRLSRFVEKSYRLYNNYGPTENAVVTTSCPVEAYKENIPIGKPIDNNRVYILNKDNLQLQPPGAAGELCIAGDSLARGYLNRTELTAEKFNRIVISHLSLVISNKSFVNSHSSLVISSFNKRSKAANDSSSKLFTNDQCPMTNDRLYRTGDLARWLPDGNIEFLGRIDQQVKIRGFRIEPGEMEYCLLELEEITDAVVIPGEMEKGEKYLCAYIVSAEEIDTYGLKERLSAALPDYMIPAYFVQIEKIPLTPNGKIDRKALPEPEFYIDTGSYVDPRDDIEKKLQDIWSGVLALAKEKISIHADFFHLGGHSLKAAIMISRIHEVLHVKVPLVEVFRTPSIKGLSGYIRRQVEEKLICIEPVEKKEYYIASAAQKRMYIIQQMNVQGIVYNIPHIIALEDEPDAKKLTETFKKLIRRHESLRTSFHMTEDRLVQRVHDDVEFAIELHTPSCKNPLYFIRPFDLAKPPLFRAGLIKMAESGHILIVDIHHIITDGVSSIILERDFTTLYNDMGEALPQLRIQYADFSEWQNSAKQKEKLNRQEEYWLKELAGDIPLLDLPTDSRRPDVFTFTGDTVLFEIDDEATRLLKQAAREEGVTLYLVMLTIFYALLSKLSSQEDIIIGTGVFGRNHADLHHVMGMFLNMIPLRNYPQGHKSFREFLGEVKKRTLEAFENQDLPFDDLLTSSRIQVERQGHATPLFDVVFSLQEMELGPEIQAIQANEKTGFKRYDYDFKTDTSKFDLTFNGMEIEGKFRMAVEYSTQLFKKERITRTIEYFKKTVTAVLENRDIRLSELDILPEEEKWELLYAFNRTGTDYPADKTLHQLFEEQAEMRPDRIAVLFGEQQLTYRELNERAARLALLLQKKGVNPNSIVGMMLERSPDMISSILAVLKASGAYLPLEPGTPQKRMLAMLEDCRAPILLTSRAAAAGYSFSTLQGLRLKKISPLRTAVRPRITDLDGLPFPDRSLVDYEKYHRHIGVAMAKHTIPILASRGCPYNCAYCHKIWPKKQVARSAENVFAEVSRLYDMGVRRFVILDDIFNLNIKNSSRFYRLITDHGPDLHLFFPGGVRGDILTHEYIDLMIRAGTINLMMALESASPRIQRLVGKNLDIERFRENLQYIVNRYPQVILETNIMMGFPTETEEEALMSLDFINEHRWIDFPNLNILKIYAGTDMERLAMKNGISREAIENSFNRAYHELPDTLPFEKSFVRKCQAELFNGYFLNKERLLTVLPYQMKVLSEDEMVRKYDSYLPVEIKSFDGLLDFFGITRAELGITGPDTRGMFLAEDTMAVPGFHEKARALSWADADQEGHLTGEGTAGPMLRVLLLDLSKTFSTGTRMLYDVTESPLGLMYLLTYLNREFGGKIVGKIAHARMDFDNYRELKTLIAEFRPDVIGVRTLTFYKDFYHQTTAAIRQWGVGAPIIAGGPYASSDWAAVLQDPNIDLVAIGEGEITFAEIIGKMIENQGKLPGEEVLKNIPGIAFVPGKEKAAGRFAREIIMTDLLGETLEREPAGTVSRSSASTDPAYVIFTSGSTGKPKGTLTTHYNVVRVVRDTNYIDLGPRDRILQLSNYAFDGSVFDIYGALINGAALVMMTGEQVLNLDRLARLLKKECITVFFVTTALFNALVDLNIESLAYIRKVLFGGERVSVDHTRRALNAVGKGKILHMYGPTETTVYASFYPVDHIGEHRETIPIGGPLANTTIFILDKNLSLVPLGVSGEICIGGQGNALGYLNNPELTAEKFNRTVISHLSLVISNKSFVNSHSSLVISSFNKRSKAANDSSSKLFTNDQCPMTNDRLYRTGDLGRWLAGGNIEFMGRLDQQVKIRGFRIEPGEIEKHLLQSGIIDQAVVIPREAGDGDRYLCAYVVPAGEGGLEVDAGELKDLLSHDLPDYMVPAHFVILDKIPLTSNGKVDRQRLPDPEVSGLDAAYAAPGDPVEEKLARMWSEILGIKKEIIGIDNDFFQLGGHSLRATILISRVHKEFHVEIPLAELFKSPFIRELAKSIKNSGRTGFSPIEPTEKKEYYKLSPAQERLYVLQQMVRDNVVYNVPQAVEIAGPLDKENLVETFKKLPDRHESLRTSFHMMGKEPVQRINDKVKFKIEYFSDTSGFIRPFDLAKAPLLRVGLIHTPGDNHVLMVDMHHIITDGTSMPLFINEFLALYAGEELPPLKLQYKDFAEWQQREEQKEVIRRQEGYWLTQFEGDIPVLNLPLDYPRPAVQSFAGAVMEFELSPEMTFKLNGLAGTQGATLYMALLAVTAILFHKLTQQEDIVIGTPIAARRHADLEGIIGMFVNTLAMRNYPVGDQPFSLFLDQVKESTLRAFENQEYPFEELVEKAVLRRNASRSPLFDAAFALQNIEMQTAGIPETGTGDLTIKPCEMESTVSKFDLTLACAEIEQGLQCIIEYCTALFRRDTVERFGTYFKRIVSTVMTEPGIRLEQIEIISEAEKRHLLIDFNDTGAEYPRDKTIHELFAGQVEKTPDKIALHGCMAAWLHGEDVSISYTELNKKSGQAAYLLKEKGAPAGPEYMIALMMEPSIEMITGILAVLIAGCAYVPLNPGAPPARNEYILKDCNIKRLLTTRKLFKKTVNPGQWEGEAIFLDTPLNAKSSSPCRVGSANPAYVIYTSGSTGLPRGVSVTHKNLSPLLHWGYRHLGMGGRDRTLQNLSYYFDWSVWEIFITLTSGAALYTAPEEVLLNPAACVRFIDTHGLTVLHITPTQYRHIVNSPIRPLTLRYLFIGAEKLTFDLAKRSLASVHEKCRVFNMYGPTEATIISAVFEIERRDYERFREISGIPIGKPVGNTGMLILDRYMNLSPANIAGELYIAGDCVASGYLNNPELTAEKFNRTVISHLSLVISNKSFVNSHSSLVISSFNKRSKAANDSSSKLFTNDQCPMTNDRLYRTGDLARWLPDGIIEYLGRIDQQVKIRGFRIEPGEIQYRLMNQEVAQLSDSYVMVREDPTGEGFLCAYFAAGREVDVGKLREYLKTKLPAYMVPVNFIQVDRMPLTPNGKIDWKALPAPGFQGGQDYIAPGTDSEKKLAGIWAEVLGLSPMSIGINDDFFQLGGNSLKAAALMWKIQDRFNVDIPLVELFSAPTVKELAQFIEKQGSAPDNHLVLLTKRPGETYDPDNAGHLFLIHDGTGEVDGYIEFCNRLSSAVDFNAWGIRAQKLENYTPRNVSVEELAEEYIQKIKSLQPHGPYYIAGWSLGGTIAFEIARQLEQQKENMAFLALIDTMPPNPDLLKDEKGNKRTVEFNLESELNIIRHYFPDWLSEDKGGSIRDIRQVWLAVTEYLEKNRFDVNTLKELIPGEIFQSLPDAVQTGTKESIYYLNMTRMLGMARDQYEPTGKIHTRVHFIKAEGTTQIDPEKWNTYCHEPVKVIEIPGDHFSILKNPEVENTAGFFTGLLQNRK